MCPLLTRRGVRTWLGGSPPEPEWPSECLSQEYGSVEGERPDTATPTASAATGLKGQGTTGNRGSLSCPTSDSGPAEKSRLLAPTLTGHPASLEPALACPLPHRPPAACLKPASAPAMADTSACSPGPWRQRAPNWGWRAQQRGRAPGRRAGSGLAGGSATLLTSGPMSALWEGVIRPATHGSGTPHTQDPGTQTLRQGPLSAATLPVASAHLGSV